MRARATPPADVQRRRLERSRRANPPPVVHAPQTRFDVWLVRVGYFAQVGVLVATILGFYYTVIPLYQKAALDELIAKREADFKVAQDDVARAKREAYEQFRLNFTQRLAIPAADRCSENRTSIAQPNLNEPTAVRHERLTTLAVEVAPCLIAAAAEHKAATVLTPSDQAFLKMALADVGKTLDEKRVAALAKIAELPRRAESDPTVLAPVGDFMARAYDFQDKVAATLKQRISQETIASRFKYQVARTQEVVAAEYRQECFKTILDTIRGIAWPRAATAPSAPAVAASS